MRKRRYSLSIHITSLFLVLTTLVGVVLIAISYNHSQALLAASAKEVSRENTRKLENAFKQSTGPIFTTLDFLAYSPVVEQPKSPITQKRWLSSIELIFQRNKSLTALYYALENGTFTILTPLRTNLDRENNQAPEKANLLIKITKLSGSNEIYFLDGNHNQIGYTKTDDNDFDPRVRPWFINADADGEIRLTDPYRFYSMNKNGITLSRRSINGQSVIGADFTLDSLSNQISEIGFSSNSKMLLFDDDFQVLAHHQSGIDINQPIEQLNRAIEDSVFQPVVDKASDDPLHEEVSYNNILWSITLTPVALNNHVRLLLAEATPQDDLISNLVSMRNKQITVALSMLILSFLIVWFVAKRLANPLQNLVHLTDNIARFDFKKTRYPKSMIKEVTNLTQSIELMEHTLHDLLRLLRETASNQDFNLLAKTITHQSYLVTRAETILLFVHSEQDDKFVTAANHAIIPFKIEINSFLRETPWLLTDLKKGEIIHLNQEDNALSKYRDYLYNSDIYFFPLLNREKQLVGVLTLGYERKITKQQSDKHAFLRELLSFAEIAKDNIDQMEQQKEMLNAFIELIASAIDTKSPYTGSHCQRVPELTKMLTKVVENDDKYFPQFSVTPKQREEIHLAAWLHDCGKVTTPEYVVDKATKLETIYDRIHEIRMRFELLKCQAEVDYWKALQQGEDEQSSKEVLSQLHQTLDKEFEFVASTNIGGESMSDADLTQLQTIGKRQWRRTLNDQLGVSWIEKQRAEPAKTLPVMESLLSDKPVHQIQWSEGFKPEEVWKESFTLQPGDLKYNRGELYNLSITKGTLNREERFIINDHIIQTISMLRRLPYPEHLKNIPDIAGGHHERVDGNGYPRGLNEDQLSIPARIMAIADVLEALTSSDRPYKKGKQLSESIQIMTEMATTGHIDPKLYLLFLENQLDQDYADAFLTEKQRDDFDRDAHVQTVKEYLKTLF
ncbi:HD domain-containing phosphohydrolase [Vibrio sp. 10N.261.55.A7]|uniref:HD domain-containing phosphohydrolase n=1 Tax=Vibrio sp. 10N.261.55.A7 TaxID=1880851 RepID=UPI000C855645|nr:HD domain-containing phosphohydrolase [Vibrio sp. 10N.261.55.A7]PMK02617.1 metal-dependent phosphohydrolase [Vibrio sp. 10N.261.55.A7]